MVMDGACQQTHFCQFPWDVKKIERPKFKKYKWRLNVLDQGNMSTKFKVNRPSKEDVALRNKLLDKKLKEEETEQKQHTSPQDSCVILLYY